MTISLSIKNLGTGTKKLKITDHTGHHSLGPDEELITYLWDDARTDIYIQEESETSNHS